MPAVSRKKRRARVRLTHMEIHRGEALRLRIAIADDAIAEVGDELGALIKKIAPGTQTAVVPAVEADFVISTQHDVHDEAFHARLRENLAELFGSLCDESLAAAMDIAREESVRRADGSN